MKKIFIGILIFTAFLFSCKSTPITSTDISEAIGENWILTEVRINNTKINFDRASKEYEGFGEIFTLKIDAEMVSGKGAPNTYSAPYRVDDAKNVKVEIVRSTLMAPINMPETLKEHEYFSYIQNTYKWELVGDKLQLSSKTTNEENVLLIFRK